MDLNLKDKKVFISGSSRGISYGIAKKFIEEGANVIINSRDKDSLKTAESLLGKCNSIVGDVTNPEEALNLVKEADNILGGIDLLICNVGSGKSVPPGQENLSEWKKVFAVNFFSTTNLVEASINFLEKSKGSIVCISSICGIETISGAPVTYSVAKSALNTYVKSIARPLAKKGIRINSVAPGNINFKGSVWSEKISQDPKDVKTMLIENVPLERFGSPEDVANVVTWLSSDLSNFITGTIVTTDGGQTRS